MFAGEWARKGTMVDTRVKQPTRKPARKRGTQTVTPSVTKQAAPVRRSRSARPKRPTVAVVVLSGSTPLRRNKAAELVAEELKLDLSKVNLSSLVSRRVGETEKNINRVFDDAERSGSILFFDGADALFGTRRGGASPYADAGAAHLLQRIEDHNGLVILTTNGKSRIDQALSRQARVSVMVGIKKKKKTSV
ncbi:ATPase_AAA_core domain-containing protein [Nitrospira defluvii]|uniref:ATPase_AAA_core domain-containing protein n=2 Tax=Nitrospira defluvii TaxID=330214 RepID=A0ABM8RJ21_9BACT|nr:ATPase_AAA_core domain-containing protein [Nitrospira defluvii]